MTDYRAIFEADQRLAILQTLQGAADYAVPVSALRPLLGARGHHPSAFGLDGHLAALDELGLVQLLGDQVRVARLTQRGDDVAAGRAQVPGVARPQP